MLSTPVQGTPADPLTALTNRRWAPATARSTVRVATWKLSAIAAGELPAIHNSSMAFFLVGYPVNATASSTGPFRRNRSPTIKFIS